ncbi:hypothetical protein [Neomoorella thermoacetica]
MLGESSSLRVETPADLLLPYTNSMGRRKKMRKADFEARIKKI